MAESKQLKVTLKKSRHGRIKSHRDCIAGLGLSKIHQSVTVIDTPQNRGMINKVSYLVAVEEV
jgi:large subunit ribosomal protein L30